MGIMVYSLLWVMQDLYHQPKFSQRRPEVTEAVHLRPWARGLPQECDRLPVQLLQEPGHSGSGRVL